MSHLSLETIARLVDEQPSALDNAHLDSCDACRAELASMRADIAALGELPDMMPADSSWSTIEARLEAEGLLRPRTDIAPASRFVSNGNRTWTPLARAAAVAGIFLAGALAGHALNATSKAPSQVAVNNPATTSSNAMSGNAADPSVTPSVTPSVQTSAAQAQAPAPSESPRSVRLASTGNAQHNANSGNAGKDASADAALRTLRQAEDKYFSALSNYSAKAGTETTDPNARLAALEGIVLTTRAALAQSPTDPVINGYHLTALAQRDAMLKQIKATPATSW